MIEDRQKYNKLILNKISEIIEKEPYIRFNQILFNLDILEVEQVLSNGQREFIIEDSFYEESEITWDRISKFN